MNRGLILAVGRRGRDGHPGKGEGRQCTDYGRNRKDLQNIISYEDDDWVKAALGRPFN